MRYLGYFATAAAVLCFACGVAGDKHVADNSYLFGKWNVVENTFDFTSALNFYPHGFELTGENKYYPRYFREEQNRYFTDTTYNGKWFVDQQKRLVFLVEHLKTTDSTFFELEKVSDAKIKITKTVGENTIFMAIKE